MFIICRFPLLDGAHILARNRTDIVLTQLGARGNVVVLFNENISIHFSI